MTARVLPLTTLAHGALRLEPLRPDHLPALHRALARPEVFAGGWGGGAAALTPERAADPDAFAAWFLDYVPHRAGLTYVVVRVPDGEPAVALDAVPEVVGTTSYGHVDLACESLHVGWTAYAPSVWGTTVNPACKLMLLEHAFASGFHRVQIQADARNDRSRAAISRLGGTFEGVLRRTNPRADGTWRDTAVYSVLAPEWPAVQAGLRARLVPVDLR